MENIAISLSKNFLIVIKVNIAQKKAKKAVGSLIEASSFIQKNIFCEA
jgi:hypothetical protein